MDCGAYSVEGMEDMFDTEFDEMLQILFPSSTPEPLVIPSSTPEPLHGVLVMGTNQGLLASFNLSSGEMQQKKLEQATRNVVHRVRFSNDTKKLFAAIGPVLYELPFETLMIGSSKSLVQDNGHIVDFCIHPHEPILYSCQYKSIKILDSRTPNVECSIKSTDKNFNCIEILPTKSVILTGESNGTIRSFDLRMFREMENAKHNRYSVKTVAAFHDDSWICAANSAGQVLDYKYTDDKKFELRTTVMREKDWATAIDCTFPQFCSEALITFDTTVAKYDSMQKKIVWKKRISGGVEDSDITSCIPTANGLTRFTGHHCGKVAATSGEQVTVLSPSFEGESITALAIKE